MKRRACVAMAMAAVMRMGAAFSATGTTEDLAPIRLSVDARDTAHNLFQVHETVAVEGGAHVTLMYPEWELSSHGHTISAASLAGLRVRAGSLPLEWTRDALDPHAFHVDVPAGIDALELDFQYITRLDEGLISEERIQVDWQHLVLYPAGHPAHDVDIDATLLYPAGLKMATPLEVRDAGAGQAHFRTMPLDELLDSPVLLAGHLSSTSVPYGPDGSSFRLDIANNDASHGAVPPAEVAALKRLMAETYAVFGRAPYQRFDALVVLDDDRSPGGYEHSTSTQISLPTNYFLEPGSQINNRDLIAHEHVHAWNGRFRQPADGFLSSSNTPTRNSLLWVYEGQTEFWGRVLAARSGMRTLAQTLDKLALDAAAVQLASGRAWKDLADTTNDPLYVTGRTTVWPDWQRRKDYYGEGVLLWLDVHAHLQELSHGAAGIDAFAHRFFAVPRPSSGTSTYTFDDVCAALQAVTAGDWKTYLQARLHAHDAGVLDGLRSLGWALAYVDAPTEAYVQDETDAGEINLRYSIGLAVSDKGVARAVVWDGAAFKAGMAPGVRILQVNQAPFSKDNLLKAVADSRHHSVALLVDRAGKQVRMSLDYRDGLRYPVLRRVAGTPDRLTPLLAPRA